jgi:hypothetical protein
MQANTEIFYKEINSCCGKTDNKPIITFDDIPDTKLKFVNGFKCKSGVHIGQRKLFLSEIQFLTNFYIKNPQLLKSKKIVYVVYAGAAPAHHTFYLATYFPHIRFILVDPNRFELRVHKNYIVNTTIQTSIEFRNLLYLSGKYENKDALPRDKWIKTIKEDKHRIYIVEEYFTDDLARMFSELNPIFISDIRTNEEEDKLPTDQDFIWNNAMQYNWAHLIKPCALLYKFRMPFFETKTIKPSDYQIQDFEISKSFGIDFIMDYNKGKFQYIKGDIYLQAFPGNASSESRLCVLGPFKSTSAYIGELNFKNHYYNIQEYENKYFYYNTIQRTIVHHYNPFANKELGFDHCNDCAIECNIWHNYVNYIKKINIQHAIINLSQVVNRNLFMQPHGYFFYPNISHIYKSINYPHINKNKVNLVIKEEQSIKKLPDMKYSVDFILDEITKHVPDKYRMRYKECIKKSFKKDTLKKNIDDIEDEFPILFNTKTFKPTEKNYPRLFILNILRFLTTYDIDELIIFCDYKQEVLTLLKKICKTKIHKYKIEQLNDIKLQPNIKYGVVIDFDYKFYISQEIMNNYNNAVKIINKIKPNYYLINVSMVDSIFKTISDYKNYTEYQSNETYPINSVYKSLKINFFDGNLWISPYAHPKAVSLFLCGSDYKKNKLWNFNNIINKYMYYSAFIRPFSFIKNKNADISKKYDNCNDCALSDYIITNYVAKYSEHQSNQNNSDYKNIFNVLFSNIKNNSLEHGLIFKNNISRLQDVYMLYCKDYVF